MTLLCCACGMLQGKLGMQTLRALHGCKSGLLRASRLPGIRVHYVTLKPRVHYVTLKPRVHYVTLKPVCTMSHEPATKRQGTDSIGDRTLAPVPLPPLLQISACAHRLSSARCEQHKGRLELAANPW